MNPVVVELVGGLCNSRCAWCFLSYQGCYDRMRHGMMGYQDFKRFIRLNKGDPFPIIPFGHGEALLNPDFTTCCGHALDNGFSLRRIHTNLAMRLGDACFKMLAKFGNVVVNVGGAVEKTHCINMGTDLGQVLLNLKRLMTHKPQSVLLKMVINKYNHGEQDDLGKLAVEIDPAIHTQCLPIYAGPADSNEEDRRLFYERNISDQVECRDAISIVGGVVHMLPKTKECWNLIPTVRWDGAVSVCCRSRYHEKPVGNAFEKPIKEIVGSSVYKEATELGKQRKWIDYCKYCS